LIPAATVLAVTDETVYLEGGFAWLLRGTNALLAMIIAEIMPGNPVAGWVA